VGLNAGDNLECRPTALAVTELQTGLAPLPYATDAQATFPGAEIACWGDSLTLGVGGTPYPYFLAAAVPRAIYNGGIGGDTSTMTSARMLADTARYSWSVIFWEGRNDGINSVPPATTLANIASQVAALGHDRYLVLSILNADTEPSGSAAYNAIIALNTSLASTYPANYLDVRAYLVSLYDPSNPTDVTNHGEDIPPSSLRSDTLHLNSDGYQALATYLATYITILDGPAAPLKPASLAPLMTQTLPTWSQPDGLNMFRMGFGAGGNDLTFQKSVDGFATAVTYFSTASGALTLDTNGGDIHASTFITVGSAGGVVICRRDNNNQAFVLYSSSGDLQLYGTAFQISVLDITAQTGQLTLFGGLSLATMTRANAPDNSLFFSSDDLDPNSAPKLCRKGPAGNVTVIG
jgi:lysophospholipase L1-like esterase